MTNALPRRWTTLPCPGSIGRHFLRPAALALLAAGLLGGASAQNIVINEIHYHPASQDVREEFVELHNAGPINVATLAAQQALRRQQEACRLCLCLILCS